MTISKASGVRMGKFELLMRPFAVGLSFLLLFFDILPAVAGQSLAKATVKGLGCAEKRDDLSLKQVREKAEKEAYKDALKSFLVFTKSEFVDLTSNDTSLVVNSINTMAVGYIYGRKLKEADKGREICFEVTGEVIPDELKELIELSSGIDRAYENEYRRQRDQYMEDERSAAKRRNDIEQSLIVKKGDAEKLKSDIASQRKSVSAKQEEYDKLQREYEDLLDMEKRNPGSLNKDVTIEKGEKVKRAKIERAGQYQKIDDLVKEQDEVNSEIRQSSGELTAIDDSLNKKKASLASFIFKSPVRVVFSSEAYSDESSSAKDVKKQAESIGQEKARYFASVFMLSRLADLPPSIEIDFPSSSLDGKLSFVKGRIIPSKMEYQDLEGRQSSGAVWIKEAGDYGKAAAMLKAAYVWKGTVPFKIAGAQPDNTVTTPTLVRRTTERGNSVEDDLKRSMAEAHAKTAALEAKPEVKEEGVRWYWYLLGALVLGGAAVALGGGGGGSGGGGQQPSTYTFHW